VIKNLIYKLLLLLFLSYSQLVFSEYGTGLKFLPVEKYKNLEKKEKYRSFLPLKHDLSHLMPPVGYQGNIGSCTGWATNYAVRSYYELVLNNKGEIFSPTYPFDAVTNESCDGVHFDKILDFMKNVGSVSISLYKPRFDSCSILPAHSLLSEQASKNKIKNWKSIELKDLDTIKGLLYSGNPVIIGVYLLEDESDGLKDYKGGIFDFNYSNWAKENNFDPNNENDYDLLSAHAMVITGYDDERKIFRVMNSWSDRWGENGYVNYSYASMQEVLREAYTIEVNQTFKLPEPSPEPEPTPEPIEDEKLEFNQENIDGLVEEINSQTACTLIKADKKFTKKIRLSGFTMEDDLKNKIIENFKNVYPEIKIQDNIEIKPWPICEVLHTANTFETNKTKLTTKKKTYKDGDILDIKFDPKSNNGYLNLFYLQANGTAVEILTDHELKKYKKLDVNEILQDVNLKISGPFGDEALIGFVLNDKDLMNFSGEELLDRDFLTLMRTKLYEFKTSGKLNDISIQLLRTEE